MMLNYSVELETLSHMLLSDNRQMFRSEKSIQTSFDLTEIAHQPYGNFSTSMYSISERILDNDMPVDTTMKLDKDKRIKSQFYIR